jgi:hypothetical protein
MLVLNTEKGMDGYQRIADVTDGDAYYWSSVNPDTNANHTTKLVDFGKAVHARGQYWIAPFAPGFDARLVGGERVVDRKGTQTLRVEYAAAVRSAPDALGLISWNEFSENTYVEPSQQYGDQALRALRELTSTPVPLPASAVDSSDPGTGAGGLGTGVPDAVMPWGNLALLGGFVALIGVGGAAAGIYLRRRQRGGRPGRRRARRRADDSPSPLEDRQHLYVPW